VSEPFEWDQAEPYGVAYKSIPVLIRDMRLSGAGLCNAIRLDAWDTVHYCARDSGHTGRHLAGSRHLQYVTAVWS
jgi:hypothetical protein